MNKTKTPKKAKLALGKQAVRLLTSNRLAGVVGGVRESCEGHSCSISRASYGDCSFVNC